MKKICFIGGGLSAGGQERALTNLANTLAERGYTITIISLFKTEVFFSLHENIMVYWPDQDREKYYRLYYALRQIFYIRRAVLKEKPSVVISFGDWFNAFVLISTLFMRPKIVIMNRMGPNINLGKLHEFWNRHLYKYADLMIVQTHRAKDIMEEKYGLKKISVIPNAIKPIAVGELKPDHRIITVGRLSREKGHDILIRAFSLVEAPAWTLHLVGDGAIRSELEQLAKELGLEERIVFYGFIKDLPRIYSKCDIFVLPSLFEGFPNALVEAMSVPLCCVASDCVAGPSEIIDPGVNGFLFKPKDHFQLAEILSELINDPELRQRIASKAKKASAIYNVNDITGEYVDVLSKVIQ